MKAIAAMASNRTIGMDGKLPWRIPGDLKFFKKMTQGCRCVVGSTTFDGLPKLEDREFIVMSRAGNYLGGSSKNKVVGQWSGEHEHSPVYANGVMENGNWVKDTWVIGGARTYFKLLPLCTDLYLTRIFKAYEGDTFFPSFEHQFKQWDVIERTGEYSIVHYKNLDPSVL